MRSDLTWLPFDLSIYGTCWRGEHLQKGVFRGTFWFCLFPFTLSMLTLVKRERLYQRIKGEWGADRGSFAIVLTEIFISFKESEQYIQATGFMKEAPCSTLPEFSEHGILNGVAFVHFDVNRVKDHVCWGYTSYKIIPRPKPCPYFKQFSCPDVILKWGTPAIG